METRVDTRTSGGICAWVHNKTASNFMTKIIEEGIIIYEAILFFEYLGLHCLCLFSGSPRIRIISPPSVVLVPPRKLALQVEAVGSYDSLQWIRNGNPAGTNDFRPSASAFNHFSEVYTNAPTTHADFGVYTIRLSAAGSVVSSASIAVIGYGMP